MSQIYSKTSFDRFGDDLSEAILSYLSLEDKVRLECMSKQSRRTVYRRQYDLTIDLDKNIFNRLKSSALLETKFIDMKAFESTLKKCESIAGIDIKYCKFFEDQESFEQMIDLVIDNCNRLTEMQYDFSQNLWSTVDRFLSKFGPNLESLELFDKQLIEHKKRIFDLCPKLKSIKIFKLSDIFDDFCGDRQILLAKKLNNIEFNYTTDDSERLALFMAQHKNCLKSVDIRVSSECDDNAIEELFTQLTEAYNLKKVKLNFSPELTIGYDLVEQIKQLGIKCFKLNHLQLSMTSASNAINCQIFETMKSYRQLKRLELMFHKKTDPNPSAESEAKWSVKSKSLRECQRLTHLILNGLEVDDKFFRYVDINLRRLQSLTISEANISGVAFCLLSELTQLTTISINSNKIKPIDDSIVYYFVGKSPKIRSIKCRQRGHRGIELDDSKVFYVKQALELGHRLSIDQLPS